MNDKTAPGVIAVAGATGFVGKALIQANPDLRFRALVRSRFQEEPGFFPSNTAAVLCDLWSLESLQKSLEGASEALYLVHSMIPSSGLTQATFEDLDLLLADNFGRACKKAGIRKIVYLGGTQPAPESMQANSDHLRSRLEVEDCLRGYCDELVALRASLILGKNGSSFEMMKLLVHRLPLMICPKWTESRSRPIALRDVLDAIGIVLRNTFKPGSYDLSGPETISYRELMVRTARIQGKRLRAIPFPSVSPRLSVLWVRLISGASFQLVKPLVESLKVNLLPSLGSEFKFPKGAMGLDVSLREALGSEAGGLRSSTRARKASAGQVALVKSIQRFKADENLGIREFAAGYFAYLNSLFWGLFPVKQHGGFIEIGFLLWSKPLLRFQVPEDYSTKSVMVDFLSFPICGGVFLSKDAPASARFEFRRCRPGVFLIAIQDYRPGLPWWLYRLTQAWIHLWVMRGFRPFRSSSHPRENR